MQHKFVNFLVSNIADFACRPSCLSLQLQKVFAVSRGHCTYVVDKSKVFVLIIETTVYFPYKIRHHDKKLVISC